MTVPLDITDPKLVRAYAHPLRIRILGVLENRTASPSEIAAELGTPLSNTSYHVRQLVALGLVELVGRTARRGAIEHHYTAKVRPTITDRAWGKMPTIVKRAVVGGVLEQTITDVLAAAEQGGWDRADAHHSRTVGPLDDEGWAVVSRELARAMERVDEAIEKSRDRIAKDPSISATRATIVLMQFEGPTHAPARKSAKKGSEHFESRGLPDLELDEATDS